MRRKNSAKSFVLQPPLGFRSSCLKPGIILSDGSLMKRDAQGLYLLDNAHRHLLANFIAQGWHAPRPELPVTEVAEATPISN
jgi:hypothetical protein